MGTKCSKDHLLPGSIGGVRSRRFRLEAGGTDPFYGVPLWIISLQRGLVLSRI
jgi:hypothetical protein